MKIKAVYAYLCVEDAAAAVTFYQNAFGVTELFRLTDPSGKVGHVELDFGGTTIMLAEEFEGCGVIPPSKLGGCSTTIHLHVDDADALVERAVAAGATLERAPQDQFYGERSGSVMDPFGHRWLIGHDIEEVSPQEMQRRYTAMFDA